MMDPIIWRTISHIAVFFGSGLALVGGIGTWYFGNQIERILPFRQPINAASATVELIVNSGEQINAHFMDSGGYLIFAKDQKAILTVSSQDSWVRQLGDDRVLYRAIFNMDVNDSAAGKPVNTLAESEYVQIFFHQIPKDKKVLNGKAVCTLNNEIRFEIDIPEQMPEQIMGNDASKRVDNNLIMIRNLKKTFKDFKK
jgi:hypothetical protein